MPTVHNYTGVPATFDYETPAGPLTGHVALGVNGNAIIGNIVPGGVHAVFGVRNVNAQYPGMHMETIYIVSNDQEPGAVWFA